jgi:hypothetical protein
MTRPRLLVALIVAALVAAAAILIWREDLDTLGPGDASETASAAGAGHATTGSAASRPKSIADVTGIRVAVRDDSGRPLAGCPVRLVGRPQVGSPFVLAETTSGEDGAALIEPDVEACLDEAAGGVTFAVGLGVLADQEVEAPVDPLAPPRDPIVLQAPPLGAVRVELRMCDGTLAKRSCEVELWRVDPASPGRDIGPAALRAIVDDGVLRWPWITVGTLFRAGAASRGSGWWRGATGTPETAGHEILLTLDIIKGPTRITGRVLDVARAPVGARDLQVIVKPLRRYQPVVCAITTTATGAFTAELSNLVTEPFAVSVVKQSNGSIEASTEERELPATCEDEAPAGDLVLLDNPLLVAGRVTDERGCPIAEAEVFILHAEPRGPELHVYSNPGGYAFKTVTDAAGAFSVQGPRKTAHVTVDASKEGYEYPPGPLSDHNVPVGASTVAIKMRRAVRPGTAGSLGMLAVTLAEASRPLAASLEVGIRDDARPGVAPVRASFDAEGVAHFSGAPAGTVEVQIASALHPEKLFFRIPKVEVPAGGESSDPRLVDVEIPGSLPIVDLTIVKDGGGAPALAEVRTQPSDLGEAPVVKVREGRARLVLPDSPLLCEITAPDMRPEVVALRPGGITASLRPAVPMAARARPQPRLPAWVQLGVELRLAKPAIRLLDPDRVRGERTTATFDHEGVLRHAVAVPGLYVARWVVVTRGDRGPITCFVTDAEPFKLTVPDSPEAELALECPAKLVESESKKLPRPARR